MVDLHTHSSASDGTDSPEQLVDFAFKQGISTIALCDHDTTSGLPSFLSHAESLPVNAIPGIEISAECEKGNCHILGLNIDIHNKEFEKVLKKLRDGRELRNGLICQKLAKLGISINIEEISEFANGDIIARPHIARVLVKKGYCSSIDDAFNRYLTKGAPAYVERFRLLPSEAITLLKNSGAKVVLAHPVQLKLDFPSLGNFVSNLKDYGLDGIEVYTPYTPDKAISYYVMLCKELNLKASGGSDYHGANKPDHLLGYYRQDTPIPDNVVEILW